MIKQLENQYLEAKKLYYEGNPIMTDWDFDQLEEKLKELESDVINIVGTKHEKEINHLSPMLSLQKIQVLDTQNLPIEKFNSWISNCKQNSILEATPKFDGSSCNIIYIDGIINTALTRGNGKTGTDITEKIKLIVPNKINIQGIVEIRGEVIIKTNLFDEKYSKDYKNPRNFVAGILGRDETTINIIKDFDFIAFEYRVHNTTLYQDYNHGNNPTETLSSNGFIIPELFELFTVNQFSELFFKMLQFRKDSIYGLDGYVIKYPNEFRNQIGETDHHPKWATAIKFPPTEMVTTIKSIAWNIGQSSEFKPIGVLEPIEIDGTTVSNVALHNIGNIIKHGLFPGAKVTIVKSGDIIPIVKDIIEPAFNQKIEDNIPSTCSTPQCKIEIQGVHLVCTNPNCKSRAIGRLGNGISAFRMENIGGSTLHKLYDSGIETIIDLFDKSKFNQEKLIESGQFKKGRALDIVFESFEKRAPITMVTLIASLSFKATGWTTSKQVAKLYEGNTPDWYGINYAAYSPFLNSESEESKIVQKFIDTINQNGYTIEKQQQTQITADTITFELTGSPKEFGFKTKDEFIKLVSAKGFVHTPLQKGTKYLITDDVSSSSSKMSKAIKLGIEIISYDQAIKM
jgi:DNA ligase (NAD+)